MNDEKEMLSYLHRRITELTLLGLDSSPGVREEWQQLTEMRRAILEDRGVLPCRVTIH